MCVARFTEYTRPSRSYLRVPPFHYGSSEEHDISEPRERGEYGKGIRVEIKRTIAGARSKGFGRASPSSGLPVLDNSVDAWEQSASGPDTRRRHDKVLTSMK